jgi:hypothetical protein
MANGNGNGNVWKALGILGVIGTMALQLVLFGQWKGVMETKLDTVIQAQRDAKIQHQMDWDRHLRNYHGEKER